MKYLCLIYHDEKKLGTLSKGDYDAFIAETLAYDEDLRQRGSCRAMAAPTYVEAATTVRVSNGWVSITESPFAAAREQLRGFVVIEARDLNEAIRVASKIPTARIGCIEVRPIKAFDPP